MFGENAKDRFAAKDIQDLRGGKKGGMRLGKKFWCRCDNCGWSGARTISVLYFPKVGSTEVTPEAILSRLTGPSERPCGSCGEKAVRFTRERLGDG